MDSTKNFVPRHILVANGKGVRQNYGSHQPRGCVCQHRATSYCGTMTLKPAPNTGQKFAMREEACAPIEALASFKGPRLRETLSFSRRASEGCDVIVIDAPSLSTASAQFENLVRMSDVIVVR